MYIAGLWVVRNVHASRKAAVIAIAAAIQLIPLAGPVLLSRDVYLYWDFGRIGAIHGGNPYSDTPRRFAGDPAFPRIGRDWYDLTLPYGPAFAAVSEGEAAIVGDSPSTAAWVYRLLAALGVLGLAALLLVRGPFAAALVGWNPLLAIHFAGGGHNDALMMLLLIGGLLLAERGRTQLVGAGWVLAAAVKWIPLVFLPLDLLARWRRGARLPIRGLVASAVVVGGIAFLQFGTTGASAGASISRQINTLSSISLPYRLTQLGLAQRPATLLCGGAFVVAYLVFARGAWRGRARLGLAASFLVVAAPWLQPWYVLWPLSLAAFDDDRTACWIGVALSAYLLRDALPL